MNENSIDKFANAQFSAPSRHIPRKVWQTFKTNTVPKRMYNAAKSWSIKNPDCEYNFLTDNECEMMIADFDGDLLECYKRTPPGAFRADIWRYCALYKFGGIYADLDTVCKYSINKIINHDDQFIVAYDANPSKLFNAFICASPKNPILEKVLSNIKEAILNDESYEEIKNNPKLLYDITGPGGLAKAVAAVTGLPEGTSFTSKTYHAGDISVRVLRKLHKKSLWSRRVMIGFRTILLCKYPGYFDDLKAAGGTHWK